MKVDMEGHVEETMQVDMGELGDLVEGDVVVFFWAIKKEKV